MVSVAGFWFCNYYLRKLLLAETIIYGCGFGHVAGEIPSAHWSTVRHVVVKVVVWVVSGVAFS